MKSTAIVTNLLRKSKYEKNELFVKRVFLALHRRVNRKKQVEAFRFIIFVTIRRDFTKRMLFDLHTHSTASDGEFSPQSLVQLAREQGIATLALTDHDTVSGLPEARESALTAGLEFIPGVELSVDFPQGEMHILGYGVQLTPQLMAYLDTQREERNQRNAKILSLLQSAGVSITMEDVLEQATMNLKPGDLPVVGKPHFARVLLNKGYIASFDEAFSQYLGKGQIAYATRKQSTPEEAIAELRFAGAVAVLAHPITLALPEEQLRSNILALVSYGLEGIEAMHSDHCPELQRFYASLAQEYGLLVTGGSDYHGPHITPGVELGHGSNNNLSLDDARIVDALKERIALRSRCSLA